MCKRFRLIQHTSGSLRLTSGSYAAREFSGRFLHSLRLLKREPGRRLSFLLYYLLRVWHTSFLGWTMTLRLG